MMDLPEQIHLLDINTDLPGVVDHVAKYNNHQEPFYVCDIGDIVEKHKIWQQYFPHIKPYYSVKCNDNIIVLELLAALGTGFECASKGEISSILNLGVSPERIIIGNPVVPDSHLHYAAAAGVNLLTVDHEIQLYKIKSLHPEAKLLIRININANKAVRTFGKKFGCDPVKDGPHLIGIAQKLGLNLVGVTFHVGSGCTDNAAYEHAIINAKKLFKYGAKLGCNFSILDIGAGFPGDKGTNFTEIAKIINSALEEHFPDSDLVTIIAEPGRYYVGSAYTLITQIHMKREVISEDEDQKVINYYINDSAYGSFSTLHHETNAFTPVATALKATANKMVSSCIYGPTCDPNDRVLKNVLLPVMNLGEYIVFENMGAYTLVTASTFNGFSVAKVHLFADVNLWYPGAAKGQSVWPSIKG